MPPLSLPAACLLFAATIASAAPPPSSSTSLTQGNEDRAVVAEVLPESVHAFNERELFELARALRDPAWAKRSEVYLQAVHALRPGDWDLLSPRRRGAILAEWVGRRLSALDAAALAATSTEITEDQARHLRLLAETGLLEPSERLALQAVVTRTGRRLALAASLQPGAAGNAEAQRSAAGAQFSQEGGLGGLEILLGLPSPTPAPMLGRPLELEYQTLKLMVNDPAGFTAKRPELGLIATPLEADRRGRLRQQLGHLFETGDRLLAQKRLEFRYLPSREMGRALAAVGLEFQKDPATGRQDWKLVLAMNQDFREADPVLVASALAHELQHVHNVARRVEKHGADVAQRLGAFQEEEEVAFVAGSLVDAAYHDPMRKALQSNVTPAAARLFSSHEELQALAKAKDSDPQLYRALLKDLAVMELVHRGYVQPQGGILNLKTIQKRYEVELKKLRAAEVAVSRGVEGLKEEAAKTADPSYRALLLGYEFRIPGGTLDTIRSETELTERLLRMIDKERRRGLILS